jgi:hypothetical protein
MSRSVELPESIYDELERAARDKGLTPAGWIAATLSGWRLCTDQPLPVLLEGLIGAIDSTGEPQSASARKPFADLIVRKLERQGLRRT